MNQQMTTPRKKYKVVATSMPKLAGSDLPGRQWLTCYDAGTGCEGQLIFVAGVLWKDIPVIGVSSSLGRMHSTATSIAVRFDLTIDDFEIEIVDA